MAPSKEELRAILRDKLGGTVKLVNQALLGKDVDKLATVLGRIGRGGKVPHWYEALKATGALPNLDGKTIGSVVEMLLVAVLEVHTLRGLGAPPLKVNPARGVDLPDFDVGVKSPSTNYCTSEPFFSAYERLLGSEHDAIVLLTDYQEKKKTPPLKLQIAKFEYLTKSQIADRKLCRIARAARDRFKDDETHLKKVVRFLAFVNQSDWLAKQLVRFVDGYATAGKSFDLNVAVKAALEDFDAQNKKRVKKDLLPLPDEDAEAIRRMTKISPVAMAVVDAADNWVVKNLKEQGRTPNDNEWNRFLSSPLDGRIGMSFALQWRFNFGAVFGDEAAAEEDEDA